jgi:hypothetical protein
MIVDLLGKTRAKIGLHCHTDMSDGNASPEEAAAIYLNEGYDAIAITDHWVRSEENEIEGLKIISGCEYDVGGNDTANGVFHIVGVGMTSDPEIPSDWKNMVRTGEAKAAEIIKRIKQHNGLALLAHPAWSLNTPAQLLRLCDFDAIEIYNSVSDWGMSDRAYSDTIADQLANEGFFTNLIAADDVHYYNGDQCRGWIMVETTDMDTQTIVRAIRAGRFYATQGPEVHLIKTGPDRVKVICSPVDKVVFQTNTSWVPGRIVRGEDIVEAEYNKFGPDRYVRVEVTDADGKKAWSNFVMFD